MNCPLCTPQSRVIWQDEDFYLLDAGDTNFPIFWRLISRHHVTEMTDLTEAQRHKMFSIMVKLEQFLRNQVPDLTKVNWAQFGCVVPHLHWHLIARWHDDSYFPETPWGLMQRAVDSSIIEKRAQKNEELIAKLPTILG